MRAATPSGGRAGGSSPSGPKGRTNAGLFAGPACGHAGRRGCSGGVVDGVPRVRPDYHAGAAAATAGLSPRGTTGSRPAPTRTTARASKSRGFTGWPGSMGGYAETVRRPGRSRSPSPTRSARIAPARVPWISYLQRLQWGNAPALLLHPAGPTRSVPLDATAGRAAEGLTTPRRRRRRMAPAGFEVPCSTASAGGDRDDRAPRIAAADRAGRGGRRRMLLDLGRRQGRGGGRGDGAAPRDAGRVRSRARRRPRRCPGARDRRTRPCRSQASQDQPGTAANGGLPEALWLVRFLLRIVRPTSSDHRTSQTASTLVPFAPSPVRPLSDQSMAGTGQIAKKQHPNGRRSSSPP